MMCIIHLDVVETLRDEVPTILVVVETHAENIDYQRKRLIFCLLNSS